MDWRRKGLAGPANWDQNKSPSSFFIFEDVALSCRVIKFLMLHSKTLFYGTLEQRKIMKISI